jgi:hypothetical protein
MSQKSSLPQLPKSVSVALITDTVGLADQTRSAEGSVLDVHAEFIPGGAWEKPIMTLGEMVEPPVL